MPLITHPALNFGPLLARQQNAIEMAFCWWADSGPFFGGGPLMARFSIVGRLRPVVRWRADYYNIMTILPYPKRHKFLCVSNVIKTAINNSSSTQSRATIGLPAKCNRNGILQVG